MLIFVVLWITSALFASVFINPRELKNRINLVCMQDLKENVLSYLPVRKEIEIVEVVKEVIQIKEIVREIPVVEVVEVPREETTPELAKLLVNNIYHDGKDLLNNTIHNHQLVIIGLWMVVAFILWMYIRGRPLWFRLKKATKFIIFGMNEGGSRSHEGSRGKPQKTGGNFKDTSSPQPNITNSATIMNVIEEKEMKPVAKDPGIHNREMSIQRYFQIYEMYLSQFNKRYWRDDLDSRLPLEFTEQVQIDPKWTYEDMKARVVEMFTDGNDAKHVVDGPLDYLAAFMQRKQKQNESIKEFADHIRELAKSAFVSMNEKEIEDMVIENFINNVYLETIQDELTIKRASIRAQGSRATLNELVEIAAELEVLVNKRSVNNGQAASSRANNASSRVSVCSDPEKMSTMQMERMINYIKEVNMIETESTIAHNKDPSSKPNWKTKRNLGNVGLSRQNKRFQPFNPVKNSSYSLNQYTKGNYNSRSVTEAHPEINFDRNLTLQDQLPGSREEG